MSKNEVRSRVEAFVTAFHQSWERAGKMPSPMSLEPELFDAWHRELADLVAAHFVAGSRTGAEDVLSGSPAHAPSLEVITDVQVDADRATVRSFLEGGPVPTYYEYRLQRVEDQWRIRQLLSFLDPPGTPLVDEDTAQGLLSSARTDAVLPDIPANLELDVPRLFSEGRQVELYGEQVPLRVVHLGDITCKSGVLTVRDFGYGDFDLAALRRRVPPGTYPAEVAVAADRNVALRLRISDLPAVSWHQADRANGSNVVGVDAGNVAVLDLATLVRCDAQYIEELFEEQASRLMDEPGVVFSLDGDVSDAVLVTSGWGDGAYPCYWGVAADGSLTSLVVDFMILAEAKVNVVRVPWMPGRVQTAELSACELEITMNDGGFVITYTGSEVDTIRVLAPDGTQLMDGHQLGISVHGDLHRQTWSPKPPPPASSTLEVTLASGYRHI